MSLGKLTGVMGWGAIAVLVMPSIALAANPLERHNPRSSRLLAQELGCRQTNVSTGVYSQPNLDSRSRGILDAGQTIRLERKGEGWARISQPVVGWVESRYLTPAVPCDPLGSTTIQNPPDRQIDSLPPQAPVATVKVICDVLPVNGLVVRSEPFIDERTFITFIAPGTHEFQFTRNTRLTRTGDINRRWVYITAPSEGWITLGVEGTPSNLGGDSCG